MLTLRDRIYYAMYPTATLIDMWFKRNTNYGENWKCPCCGHKLLESVKKEYESLMEHVEDPNAEEYPTRSTWVCVNPMCIISKSKCFYGYDGDVYTTGAVRVDEKHYHAVNSWSDSISNLLAFERSWLGKALKLNARWVLCVMGIHSPIEREKGFGDPFCGCCRKEMGKRTWLKYNPLRIDLTKF